jgi:drug/metabolite transporter (DMT)-like permease
VRNLFHFTGQNLWFMSLTLIPLATVFALEFTAPIWVMLLSPLLLAERLTRLRWIAAGAGFLGVLIIVRPDLGQPSAGMLLAAGSAIGFAGSAILTKRLTRHEGVISILFWLTLMQAGLALLASGHDGRMTLPDAVTLPWLAVVGATGVLAHLCLTRALALAPATVVMPMDFLRLPVIALVGALLYGEAITPALAAGAALILGANWINIRFATPRAATEPNVISP